MPMYFKNPILIFLWWKKPRNAKVPKTHESHVPLLPQIYKRNEREQGQEKMFCVMV